MKGLKNLSNNKKNNVKVQRSNFLNENNNFLEKPKKKNTRVVIDSRDNSMNKSHKTSSTFKRGNSLELKNEEIEILDVIDEIPNNNKWEFKTNKNEIKNKMKDNKGKKIDLKEEKKMGLNGNNKNLNKNPRPVVSEQIKRIEKPKEKININCIPENKNEKDLNVVELKNKIKEFEKQVKMYKEIELKYQIENNDMKKELDIYKDENKNLKTELEKFKNEYNELITKRKEMENKNEPYNIQEDNVLSSLYKKPTLIGLNNIGATCFMNSTLQCLSQTEALTNYFLNKRNLNRIMNNNLALKNKNSNQLAPVYLELIQKLWDKNNENKSFSPNAFMQRVSELNPLFKTGTAGDAKDFIIFVLERLHIELKKPNKSVLCDYDLINNQYDAESAFHFFFKDFKKDSSIISEVFFGYNETTNECLNCKAKYQNQKNPICYNYGLFNCLIFPLEEVKNMVNRNFNNNLMMFNNFQNNNFQMNNSSPQMNNNFQMIKSNPQMNINNPLMNNNIQMNNCNIQMNNNNILKNNGNFIMGNIFQANINSVTLHDCFCFNQKVDLFQGENRNYCNICKQTYDSYYTSKILISPDILVLILNRGRGNIYNVKLIFDESIDITEFVQLKDRPKIIYNLYGVITHIGQSGPNAHFVASCKSPIDNKWYRYNDAFVNPINDLQKDVIQFGTPYILFYQKKKY